MAAPPSVQEDYSNRRMTRSAFKRIYGSGETDREQQQKQKQKLRPPSIIRRRKGGKIKPWFIGNIIRKTQKQQRNEEENQKSEGQQEKIEPSFTNESVRNFVIEQRKQRIPFTRELEEYYKKVVEASEGFDYGDLPDNIDANDAMYLVRPVRPLEGRLPLLEKVSKSSIYTYNKLNKTKYRFVKLVKANYLLVSGSLYYITFAAKDKVVGSIKNFQAWVHCYWNRYAIFFCRLEQPPEGSSMKGGTSKAELTDDSKLSMAERGAGIKKVKPEEDPVEPKKPPPADFWFFEDFKKDYRKLYPNASVIAVGVACAKAWDRLPGAERAKYEEKAELEDAEYVKALEAYEMRMEKAKYEEKNRRKGG